MSSFENSFCAASFSGVTRLFPLAGPTLFPHAVQAFHIFEPRYRNMLRDALADDRLIGMAIASSSGPLAADGLLPTVCLGQVIHHTPLPDGRSNILLMGLRRARIVNELPPQDGYRRARVELVEEQAFALPHPEQVALDLLESLERRLPETAQITHQLASLIGKDLSLGVLTDLMAQAIPDEDGLS